MQKHLKVVSTNNIDATPNKQKTVLKKGLHIQLRDGVWQAHIFYKNQTVRKSTGTADIEAAKRSAWQYDAEIRQQVSAGFTVKTKLFEDVCAEYVKFSYQRYLSKEIGLGRYENVKHKCEIIFPQFFKNSKISDLSRTTISNFKDWRTATFNSKKGREGVSSSSLSKDDQVFSGILKYALNKGYIKDVPVWTRTRETTEKRVYFEKSVFFAMMRRMRKYIDEVKNTKDKKARIEMYRAVMILVGTGMRPQELLPMTGKDENGNSITTRGLRGCDIKRFFFDEKVGKYVVEIYIIGANNKNSEDGRYVYMSGAAAWHLKRQYECLDERNRKIERVFSTNFRSTFTRFLERTGFRHNTEGHRYTMYSLRHSYITWKIESKKDMNAFQFADVCGNSVATIQKYYNKSKTKNFYQNFI